MRPLIENLNRLYFLPDNQQWHQQTETADFYPAGELTEDLLVQSFTGQLTIGLNLVNAAGLARTCVVDLDRKEDWPVIPRLIAAFEALGLPAPAISVSGRKGFGLWLSLAEPMPVGPLQTFLRLLRATYLPTSGVDLRPDVAGPSKSAQAVMKLAPCLHQASGKWSGFIPADQVEAFAETPWYVSQPDLTQQSELLAEVRSATPQQFQTALQALQAQQPSHQERGPGDQPHLDRLPEGRHPPCIQVLLEQGAPSAMDYNKANLNLAAYCHSRGLASDDSQKLAQQMAEHTVEHPTTKDLNARLRNFRSNQNPPRFLCDFPRHIKGWSAIFGGASACTQCPANPGFSSGSSTKTPHTSTRLEAPVALELVAHAWHTRQGLPSLTEVWPTVAPPEPSLTAFPGYALVAQAVTEGATASAYFHAVELWLTQQHCATGLIAAYQTVATDFLERVLATHPTEVAAQAALQRALELAARAQIEAVARAALQQGPGVSANAVALQLRNGVDAALRRDSAEGPLARHRDSLFGGLARTVGGDAVPTPFPGLNGLLHGGFKSGRLYVTIAPPKSGKTTFAAVVMDFAAAAGHPVLYLGYEMSREQMVEYALARRCQLNSSLIETRNLSITDAERVATALDNYLACEGQWLELWEAGIGTTLADAAAWTLQAKARQPDQAPLIVVDYLQLARVGIKEVDSHQSETKRVSEVAVACKDLARKTGAAVLALSSVTKEAERQSRAEGELDVTAARDSLAIVHAADGVLTLQTATIEIKTGKGENKITTTVDPWRYLEHDWRQHGRETEAVKLSRALDRLDQRFPQQPQSGPDHPVRARLSLIRHRGRTGEVALYYRRGFHALEEVMLPGLEPRSSGTPNVEQTIRVFQQYVATAPAGAAVAGALEPAIPAADPAMAEPPLPHALAALEYRYLTELEEARAAISALSGRVGLDFETTGLCPLQSQPRLLSLYDGQGPVLVIDLFRIGGLHLLREQLESLQAVAHNAVFDMKFLRHHGQVSLNLDCTLLAQHLIAAGQRVELKLQDLARVHLGLDLDKAERQSDWRADRLTEGQLRYAALDALVVQQIFPRQWALLETLDSLRAYQLTRAAQPAVVSMELAGMAFDAAAQQTLMARLAADKVRLEQVLSEALQGGNPGSTKQLSDWLIGQLGGPGTEHYAAWPKTGPGQLKTGQDDLRNGLSMLPEAAAHVVREALLPYKEVTKKLSAFGTSLADKINPLTGRIHAHYSLAGTVTGRMSCSQPNLQQIPKDKLFRALFAAPQGRVWVIADYTQMELRCAAHIAEEDTLLQAYRDGQDTHALTAAMLMGLSAEQWAALPDAQKAEKRQLAKAVNFGLLYGQGAKGLQTYAQNSYGVTLSEDQARQHRKAWFAAYPAFSRWQARSARAARHSLEVKTPAGRVRRWENVADFKETCAYNTPVQGAGAEVLLAALAALHDRLIGLDAVVLAVIHDEIIVECAPALGEHVKALLEESMIAGMLAIFPEASTIGLVEAHLAHSWAGKGGEPAA